MEPLGAVGDLCFPQQQIFLRGNLSSTSPCPPHPPCSLISLCSATLPGTRLHWFVPKATFLPFQPDSGPDNLPGPQAHSRAQAPNPCLGGELLEGRVGAGLREGLGALVHPPARGGQCRDITTAPKGRLLLLLSLVCALCSQVDLETQSFFARPSRKP